MPSFRLGLHIQFPVRTGRIAVDQFSKPFWFAFTNVRGRFREKSLSYFVVDGYSVTLNVLFIPLATEPLQVLSDDVVVSQLSLLEAGVCVFEPNNEFPLVHPSVVMAQNYRPGITYVENEVGVGCDSRYDERILVGVREGRQLSFFFRALLGQLRGPFF